MTDNYLIPVWLLPHGWRISSVVRLDNGKWRMSLGHQEHGGICGDYALPKEGFLSLLRGIPEMCAEQPIKKVKGKVQNG